MKGLGEEAAQRMVAEREEGGLYGSLSDFSRRTGTVGKPLENLVLAGAFDRLGEAREQLLWDAYALTGEGRQPGLDIPEERPQLPQRPAHEQTLLDYAVLGFSLDRHLVGHYRRRLAALKVLPSGGWVRGPRAGWSRWGVWWCVGSGRAPRRGTSSSRWRTRGGSST